MKLSKLQLRKIIQEELKSLNEVHKEIEIEDFEALIKDLKEIHETWEQHLATIEGEELARAYSTQLGDVLQSLNVEPLELHAPSRQSLQKSRDIAKGRLPPSTGKSWNVGY